MENWLTQQACQYDIDGQLICDPPETGSFTWSHTEKQSPPSTNPTPPENPTTKCGSIVNVDQMSLGESVPVAGTPFALVYSSARVPGNAGNYRLRIPLAAEGSPDYVNLKVEWLGQTLKQNNLTPSGYYDFVWNGLDSAGQEVLAPIGVRVTTLDFYPSPVVVGVAVASTTPGYDVVTAHWLGSFDARSFGLGGWSLSPLHYLHGMDSGWDLPVTLYLGDGSQRTVTPQAITGATTGEAWRVVDESGAVMFTFDAQGKHLYTRDGLSNAIVYKFAYDANGHVTAITDSFGNQTRILRNAQGAVTGIRSPYAQLTKIARNATGWITRISNPNAEAFTMSYKDAKGLLKTFRKPGGQLSSFSYDAQGRLRKAACARTAVPPAVR